MKKHYDSKFILVGAAIALLGVFGLIQFFQPSEKPEEEQVQHDQMQVEEEEERTTRRFTDGVFITEEEQVTTIFAVMIENSAEAWPLQGLADARLVFEAPVEGAIPRFMAIFDDKQDLDELGPIRSARPYYVDWAYGLDAMYVHVGGSPEALSLLKRLLIKDLNEFFWGKFFWRSQKRFAPHNVYTSIKDLTKAFEAREFSKPELGTLFSYAEQEPSVDARGEDQFITIPFSPVSSIYDARWKYSSEENHYQRYQGNEEQEEKDGDAVFAKNIIVLFSDIAVIDDVGRRSIRTIGEGEALLFQNGQKAEITWKKDARDEMLRFLTKEGADIQLNAGATWVEVVSEGTDISVE